ncbi:hypothetical protein HN446_01270 [bacterium]|nr:hypothetical protein [bacterium]
MNFKKSLFLVFVLFFSFFNVVPSAQTRRRGLNVIQSRNYAYGLCMQEKLFQALRGYIHSVKENNLQASKDAMPEVVRGCIDMASIPAGADPDTPIGEFLEPVVEGPSLSEHCGTDCYKFSGKALYYKKCLYSIVDSYNEKYRIFNWRFFCRSILWPLEGMLSDKKCMHAFFDLLSDKLTNDKIILDAIEVLNPVVIAYFDSRDEFNDLYKRNINIARRGKKFELITKKVESFSLSLSSPDIARFIIGYGQVLPDSLDDITVEMEKTYPPEDCLVEGSSVDESLSEGDDARDAIIRDLLAADMQESIKSGCRSKKYKKSAKKKPNNAAYDYTYHGLSETKEAGPKEEPSFMRICDVNSDKGIDCIILYRPKSEPIPEFFYKEDEHIQRWFDKPKESFRRYQARKLKKSHGKNVVPDSHYEYGCIMHRFSREVDANMWAFGVASEYLSDSGTDNFCIVVSGELHRSTGECLFGTFNFTFEELKDGIKSCYHRCFHRIKAKDFLKGYRRTIHQEIVACACA